MSLLFNNTDSNSSTNLNESPKFLLPPTKPLFNSKLFLNLDFNTQEELNDSINEEKNTKEDFSSDFEQMFLSNELIQDLNNDEDLNDNLNDDKNKEENISKTNIINSLISLAKDGYEFKPKNYKSEKINKDKFGKNKFNNKKRENKNDWICPFCNNLNFSFRKICNKCKINKISADLHINNNLCVL